MRINQFLHKLLGNVIHLKRVQVLSETVETSIKAKTLTLSSLGRLMQNKAQTRSNIRKVDRLLGNTKLMIERIIIYKQLAGLFLENVERPHIIVDASKLPWAELYILRASYVAQGRAFTIYEELYPKREEGSVKLYKRFLKNLKHILPSCCRPIIITDAGFHNPWFKLLLNLGWDFIGRIRGLKIYRPLDSSTYRACRSLWKKATDIPKYIGKVILNRKNSLECHIYLYKGNPKGRIKLTKTGKQDQHKKSLEYGRSNREPWILASSLGGVKFSRMVIKTYKKRMQIEESFRDLKSSVFGLGFEQSRTKKQNRCYILLLIGMLATTISSLFGRAAEQQKLHYKFQANSVKRQRVLSHFNLGCQIIYQGYLILYEAIQGTIKLMAEEQGLIFPLTRQRMRGF